MKAISLILLITFLCSSALAQQRVRPDGAGGWIVEDTGGCGGLFGAAQGACIADQQRMQQQQLLQQQLLQQQQFENQRLQNELLRRKLEQEQSANQSRQQSPQADYSKTPEFQNWQSANPWYGTDRAKTEFALLYAKQLKQDRPELTGKAFLDAVSDRIKETFGAEK